MNSKIIFDHVRLKLGSTQKQYDALLRMLNSGTKVEDIAEFVGLSTQDTDGMEQGKVDASGKFQLSTRSIGRLSGVHPDLVKVVKRAIQISNYDFMVVEGLRTIETQREYVKNGVSKTMNSFHLTGHAVDLAPLENGAIDWENKKGQFDSVAKAMMQAAKELGVKVVYGGVWDKNMTEYDNPQQESLSYVGRQRSKGLSAFIDKPHFQVSR